MVQKTYSIFVCKQIHAKFQCKQMYTPIRLKNSKKITYSTNVETSPYPLVNKTPYIKEIASRVASLNPKMSVMYSKAALTCCVTIGSLVRKFLWASNFCKSAHFLGYLDLRRRQRRIVMYKYSSWLVHGGMQFFVSIGHSNSLWSSF